jgi:Fur family ferric uptake transcriptional regulator
MRTIRKNLRPGGKTLQRALERYRDVLHERALKMSRVREAIARAALAQPGHFSVEDLVRALKAKGVSEAHMATVYRAIPLMVQAGLIQPTLVAKTDSQHYEVAFEREHHDHLVCIGCGRVVEYQSEALQALQREIATRYEFQLDEHTLSLRGHCKSCRRGSARPANRGGSAQPRIAD